jgi:hypothetical protein
MDWPAAAANPFSAGNANFGFRKIREAKNFLARRLLEFWFSVFSLLQRSCRLQQTPLDARVILFVGLLLI